MTVSSVFLGFDSQVPARYDERAKSHFEVISEDGKKFGVVYFGPDIYPGQGDTLNPNPTLPMHAAVAHEVVHFHRHRDGTQFNEFGLEHLDEALTSLEAAIKFPRELSGHDVSELVRDAAYRIMQFRHTILLAQAAGSSVEGFLNPAPGAAEATEDSQTTGAAAETTE